MERIQLASIGIDLNVGLLLPLALFRCSLPLSKGADLAVLKPLLTVRIPRLLGGGYGELEVLLVLLVAVF